MFCQKVKHKGTKALVNVLSLDACTSIHAAATARGDQAMIMNIPYLFAYKPIPAISRDPKLGTQNTDPMLTKKFRKLSAYSRDPKLEQSTRMKHKKYCANFLGNLQIQVEVNNKHDRSANL